MQILGLVFAGTATPHYAAMAQFVRSTLGLRAVRAVGGIGRDADDNLKIAASGGGDLSEKPELPDEPRTEFFNLRNGTRFAVAGEREPGRGTSRTIGFLVDDLDEGVAELKAVGINVDAPIELESQRYAHFIAPDGALYELIEERRIDHDH